MHNCVDDDLRVQYPQDIREPILPPIIGTNPPHSPTPPHPPVQVQKSSALTRVEQDQWQKSYIENLIESVLDKR